MVQRTTEMSTGINPPSLKLNFKENTIFTLIQSFQYKQSYAVLLYLVSLFNELLLKPPKKSVNLDHLKDVTRQG